VEAQREAEGRQQRFIEPDRDVDVGYAEIDVAEATDGRDATGRRKISGGSTVLWT
jgi:hypothetical protein